MTMVGALLIAVVLAAPGGLTSLTERIASARGGKT